MIVDINGMGRIGLLVLQMALGGIKNIQMTRNLILVTMFY
tara:strand:- start:411 stop:530 length:120 start_codon:yes stop_codon:yes gene_type:complete